MGVVFVEIGVALKSSSGSIGRFIDIAVIDPGTVTEPSFVSISTYNGFDPCLTDNY